MDTLYIILDAEGVVPDGIEPTSSVELACIMAETYHRRTGKQHYVAVDCGESFVYIVN